MGRFDREIGIDLAEELRSAGFDAKLAQARLLKRVAEIEKQRKLKQQTSNKRG